MDDDHCCTGSLPVSDLSWIEVAAAIPQSLPINAASRPKTPPSRAQRERGLSMVRINHRFTRIAFCLTATLSASVGLALADNAPKSSVGSCFSADSRDKSLREV